MTDAEFEAQKARVEAYFDQWVQPLGLGMWDITYIWHRDRDDDGIEQNADMACTPMWEYLAATIDVYLYQTIKRSDEWVELAVVHELCHCLADEIAVDKKPRPTRRNEEHVISSLAKAFIWTKERGASDAPQQQRDVGGLAANENNRPLSG